MAAGCPEATPPERRSGSLAAAGAARPRAARGALPATRFPAVPAAATVTEEEGQKVKILEAHVKKGCSSHTILTQL